MKKYLYVLFFASLLLLISCQNSATIEQEEQSKPETAPEIKEIQKIKMLSLGDSYTIGESVCETCRFPEQLKDSILVNRENVDIELKVIARTGWTTSVLKEAIAAETITEDYDLSTLLIGVNNQFQGRPFNIFEKEFPELVNKAIKYTQGKKERLIVVSIPDYAFTPFGNNNNSISQGIDKYNTFIESYCNQNKITYVFITDITREGIQKPELVANDGLHPSTFAYSQFVNRILPKALEKFDNFSN